MKQEFSSSALFIDAEWKLHIKSGSGQEENFKIE
jgi:hypothetical protein